MQIYPIAVVYEMELTVCDNRFGRRQIKQYSVAFAMSLRQRAGIDAEQHSRLSFSVHIIHGQFGIFTANLTGQRTAENCGFFGPLITPLCSIIREVSCFTAKKTVSSCNESTRNP